MAPSRHRIFVAKDAFKFSCAHMTVFPDGSKERLHGHNYTIAVALDLSDVSLAAMVDFAPLKRAILALCAELKERVILAERNPHFALISATDAETELTLCGQRYVLPTADVLLLPIENATVEQLAVYLTDRLLADKVPGIFPAGAVAGIEVTVTESPGQGARHYRALE